MGQSSRNLAFSLSAKSESELRGLCGFDFSSKKGILIDLNETLCRVGGIYSGLEMMRDNKIVLSMWFGIFSVNPHLKFSWEIFPFESKVFSHAIKASRREGSTETRDFIHGEKVVSLTFNSDTHMA